MTLLYQRSNQLAPDEAAAARALEDKGVRVRYRNAQAFYGRDLDKGATLVVTDVPKVREAYEAAGVDVLGVSGDPEEATYRIAKRFPGWYDVVGPDGAVNDKALREKEANALLDSL